MRERDELYEEIIAKGWNDEQKFFCQTYEDKDVLDSAMLIMPMVFFCAGVSIYIPCAHPLIDDLDT